MNPQPQQAAPTITLCVTEFTRTPGARYRTDGPNSGEQFREEYLAPRFAEARQAGCTLLVDLDGTAGYATSFLEEAFGGLARAVPIEQVLSTVVIKSDEEPRWKKNIERYIVNARGRA